MSAQFQVDEVLSGQSSDISILWYLDFCGELGAGASLHGLKNESLKLRTDRPTLVGRGVGEEECLILNARISRRHAALTIEPTGIRVKDFGSTNGTFVNGRQIEEALISVGDVVTFDQVNFRVRRGLDLVNETEIIDFDKPLEAHALRDTDHIKKATTKKSKSNDTAGLARARLQSFQKGTVSTAGQATKKTKLKSRYSSVKPVFIGTSLALLFFSAALYLIKFA